MCWKVSTLSDAEYEKDADSLEITERLARARRAPPNEWVRYNSDSSDSSENGVVNASCIVRDPRDVWHVGDILSYKNQPVQVSIFLPVFIYLKDTLSIMKLNKVNYSHYRYRTFIRKLWCIGQIALSQRTKSIPFFSSLKCEYKASPPFL